MAGAAVVLAGPIVRRVEARSASIWVALGEPGTVRLSIWRESQKATSTPGRVQSGDAPWATGSARTMAVGQHLHVALVTVSTVQPDLPMPAGTIHAYDVQVETDAGARHDLRSLGFLQDESGDADVGRTDPPGGGDPLPRPPRLALGYAKDTLPSFVTPPGSLDDLVLAHVSCRSTLGPGHDAMGYLDEVLDASIGLAEDRPQQLFLTGDQVYADSVALPVLHRCNQLGLELFGRHETVPVQVPGGDLLDVETSLAELPLDRRTRLLRRVARFTSGSTANHLVSFAEYCAMYLLAWSPLAWSTLPTPDEAFAANTSSIADLLTPREQCAIEALRRAGRLTPADEADPVAAWRRQQSSGDDSRWATHVELTRVYRRAVPQAARVLANVASYMIFDDHEVTDDWNLTQAWVNRVNSSSLGRSIVRNGLAAYTVFQGWGNDPAQFAAGDAKSLLDGIGAMMTGSPPGPDPTRAGDVERLLGLSGAAPAVAFHYRVDGPLHRVVVLDTRTRRSFAGRFTPPALLGESLSRQLPKETLPSGLEALFVVSAVPALGPLLIDAIGQPARIMAEDFSTHVWRRLFPADEDPCAEEHPLGLEEFDAESWARNEDALEELLARLAGTHDRVVLLSGDVHYAASLALDYWTRGGDEAAAARIVQLTASPARNVFKPLVENLLRAAAIGQRVESIGLPATRLAWKDAAEPTITLPPGASLNPALRGRMHHDPVLLPATGWPDGTTVAADPDWSWRVDLLRDPRPDAERPLALATPPGPQPDVDRDVDGHLAVTGRHAVAAHAHFDHVRQIVFPNNVGVVRLPVDDDGQRLVRHELVSEDPTDPRRTTPDGPGTLHEVAFAPSAGPRPVLTTLGEDDDG